MNKSSHDLENVDLIPAPYGKEIVYVLSRQLTAEYGKQIVQTVSGQLTAEYGRGCSGNTEKCRFISPVSSFINFHPQLIDLKEIKKICWRMAF